MKTIVWKPTNATPTNPLLQGGLCLIHGWWRDRPTCPGCNP